jgi:hypothetical protein
MFWIIVGAVVVIDDCVLVSAWLIVRLVLKLPPPVNPLPAETVVVCSALVFALSLALLTLLAVAAWVVEVLVVVLFNWTIPAVVVLADVKRALGTVPEAILDPFKDVKPLPSPTNAVAVNDPDIVSPETLTNLVSRSVVPTL